MQNKEYNPPPASNITISAFAGVKSKCIGSITLMHFLEVVAGIRPNPHRDAIEKLRCIDKQTNRARYDAIKRDLPCVTISCNIERGKSHSIQNAVGGHTGAMCIDIDSGDNPDIDWKCIRTALGKLPFVYCSALSAGGKGICLIIAVNPDQEPRLVFEAAQRYFADLGLTIDAACKNVNRLRYLTFDRWAIITDKPQAYFKAITPRYEAQAHNTSSETKKRRYIANNDSDRVCAALALLRRSASGASIDHTTRTNVGRAFASAFGASGASYFAEFSSIFCHRQKKDVQREYAELERTNRGAVSLGTFYHVCEAHGIDSDAIRREMQGA